MNIKQIVQVRYNLEDKQGAIEKALKLKNVLSRIQDNKRISSITLGYPTMSRNGLVIINTDVIDGFSESVKGAIEDCINRELQGLYKVIE